MTRATVITDASFCSDTNAAGWAAWIRVDFHAEPVRLSGPFRTNPETSGEAEIWAAVNGIFAAARHGATVVLVQSDNLGVVEGINGHSKKYAKWWNAALKRAFSGPDAPAVPHLHARHVKGHSKNSDARSWVNRWCDRKSRAAMRERRAEMGEKA